jgi:YD repeat-containing protein
LGFWTYFEYDQVNRRSRALSPRLYLGTLAYDEAGNLLKRARAAADGSGAKPVYFAYDALNRLERVLDGEGSAAYFGYDAVGNLDRSRDGLGHASYFFYDPLNRLAVVRDALGRPTYFGYDLVDRLGAVRDALGQAVYFGYDETDRRCGRSPPPAGSKAARSTAILWKPSRLTSLDNPCPPSCPPAHSPLAVNGYPFTDATARTRPPGVSLQNIADQCNGCRQGTAKVPPA